MFWVQDIRVYLLATLDIASLEGAKNITDSCNSPSLAREYKN